MSLLEQQNFLARIYTDPRVRDQFVSEPETVGLEYGLNPSEIDDLKTVAGDDIVFFSDSLIWKRLREVERLLPRTRKALGADFCSFFFKFAPAFNPQHTRKHYEDAVKFCDYVEAETIAVSVKNAARYEKAWLTFINERPLVTCCRLSRDRNPDTEIRTGRLGLVVWIGVAGRTFHFNF